MDSNQEYDVEKIIGKRERRGKVCWHYCFFYEFLSFRDTFFDILIFKYNN